MTLRKEGILSITYITVLTILLVMPLGDIRIEQVQVSGLRGDYIVHCLVYTPWMFLGKFIFSEKFNILKWLIIGIIYVAVMEFTQYLIPYRGYNIYDLIAGEVGLICSYLLMLLFRRIRISHKYK